MNNLFVFIPLTVLCIITCISCDKERISKLILSEQNANDPFHTITEEELQKEWSLETEDTLLSKIEKLQHTFQEFVYVEVKLVGFDNEGQNNIKLDEVRYTLRLILLN